MAITLINTMTVVLIRRLLSERERPDDAVLPARLSCDLDGAAVHLIFRGGTIAPHMMSCAVTA